MTRALALLALVLAGGARACAAEAAPGAIYVQTARAGVTLTAAGKDAKPLPVKPGQTFAASGQLLDMLNNSAVALILSNGDSLYFPLGGRVALTEFTQDPTVDTTKSDRDYEPSRSTLRLNLALGTLVTSGRKPDATSTFALTTPLARFDFLSPAFVVRVEADSVTVILLEGTAEINIPETGFHDTLQAGQTATLTRQNLKATYPLKLAGIATADQQKYSDWLAAARMAERRVTFTGTPGKLEPHTQITQEFTQQMSVDDPRFRQ